MNFTIPSGESKLSISKQIFSVSIEGTEFSKRPLRPEEQVNDLLEPFPRMTQSLLELDSTIESPFLTHLLWGSLDILFFNSCHSSFCITLSLIVRSGFINTL